MRFRHRCKNMAGVDPARRNCTGCYVRLFLKQMAVFPRYFCPITKTKLTPQAFYVCSTNNTKKPGLLEKNGRRKKKLSFRVNTGQVSAIFFRTSTYRYRYRCMVNNVNGTSKLLIVVLILVSSTL